MTRAKRPLPSLRFVIRNYMSNVLFKLIPQTTPKGRVMQDLWAMPGCQIMHTEQLIEHCRQKGWRHRIEGEA